MPGQATAVDQPSAQASAPHGLARLLGPYRVLRGNRNLALLFGGQVVSSLGDWLYITVLVVLVYSLTGSAALAALLTFVRLLPYALVLPLSGVLADRFDRKRLMIVADLGRAACMIGLLAVHSRGTVWIAFPLVFVSTCLFSLFRPAMSASLPAVAGGDEHLVQANTLMAQISGLSLLLGPALGGVVIAMGHEHSAFVINAATYLASTATLLCLRIPARTTAAHTPHESWLHETLAGFRFLFRNQSLEAVTVTTAAGSWFNGAIWTLVVVLAERSWHVGESGAGYLNAAMGIGALLSGFLIGGLLARVRLAHGYMLAMAATVACIALIGVSPAGLLPIAALASFGIFDVFNQVMGDTIIQQLTPDELLGRVFAALETTVIGGLMLGALVCGPLIGAIGPRATAVSFAIVPLAMLLAHLPRLRRLTLGAPAPAPASFSDADRAAAGQPVIAEAA
jgi:MFS family permease